MGLDPKTARGTFHSFFLRLRDVVEGIYTEEDRRMVVEWIDRTLKELEEELEAWD